MNLPEPHSRTFRVLMSDIEKGQVKIPQFQRDFVWDLKRSARLLDSIIKSYPIGTFILWKTKERLRMVKNVGGFEFPEPDEGDFTELVLDGQQRLTTLFAAWKGEKVKKEDGHVDDFGQMHIDLEAKEDEPIVVTDVTGKSPESLIKLRDLLNIRTAQFVRYPSEYHGKLDEYRDRITNYNFSLVSVKEAPLNVATEIFTRINTGGKELTLFEIMVAKTYDEKRDFDLATKFDELVEDLRIIGYETISDATILQTVAVILEGECTRNKILSLKKQYFIDTWEKAKDAIERACEYFSGYYRIPVSGLLPYSTLIVPFAYFFYKHPDRPIGNQQKYLQDFFWRCSLSGRYSSGVESKLAQDVKRIDLILKDELPKYEWGIDTSPVFIENNGWFSTSRSYVKAILCVYAYHEPKSFVDDSKVNISNDYLKQANSKNYHHFFPKDFLKKKGETDFYINHILNITVVDDFLNKREIKSKAPSKYMKEFQKINPTLGATMKTHLIGDLARYGVWDDDYDKFFVERAKAVGRELRRRLVKQAVDDKPQPSLEDDTEPIA
ncbi:MAG: DUF262 domain-containing protein [Candidatus Tectomicrobia bacterium]|uniref:DUF262 domain-containing protein n=1 Tax=Tectimicrobiota bacterium TaxID=2528274 RepID=A0A933LQ11_UNCTE|nr:DUF262 domain-containing protein [Candidatus Tectomicrobia bacterium]